MSSSSSNRGVPAMRRVVDASIRGALAALLTGLLPLMGSLAVAPAGAQEAAKPAEAGKQPENTVRPDVGKPIQAARELIQARKYKEALAKVREAEAVPNLTAYEKFAIELTRGSAAEGAGENDVAMSSLEAVVASGRLPAADQLKVIAAVAGLHYQAKEYAKAISWAARFEKEGGADPGTHQLLIDSYYLSGDNATAARLLKEQVENEEKAGHTPSEEQLRLLSSCYFKMNDNAGYTLALEKLVAHYPNKNYWADLISHVRRKPGFSERLDLDVLRLQLATGNLSKPNEYMEMAQLALQAGFPAEAKKVMDLGYSSGVLGKGADVERQNRLRDLANKQAADDAAAIARGESEGGGKDGDAMIAIGYNLVLNGKNDRGLSLMEQGLKQGPLKHPDEGKLHVALGYVQAGQRTKATQLLQSVRGGDGAADIARLWLLQTNHGG